MLHQYKVYFLNIRYYTYNIVFKYIFFCINECYYFLYIHNYLGIKTGDQLISGTRIPCHSWRDLYKLPLLINRYFLLIITIKFPNVFLVIHTLIIQM